MPVQPLPIAAVWVSMAQEVGASSAFILRLCLQDAATSVSLPCLISFRSTDGKTSFWPFLTAAPLENSDSQRDCCVAIKSREFKPGQSELMARNKVSNTCLTLHMTLQDKTNKRCKNR